MQEPLRVLIVEDNPDDGDLVVRYLRSTGFEPTTQRVDTAEDLASALASDWQIVICDYSMPRFSAPEALRLVRAHDPDLPFIAISGTVGEEVAVDILQAGADDYVMKDRLARLAPAVRRALQVAAERRDKRRAEEELRRAHEALERRVAERTAELSRANEDLRTQAEELCTQREELEVANEELRVQQEEILRAQRALDSERRTLRAIIDNAPEAIVLADAEARVLLANPAAERIYQRPVPYGKGFASHDVLRLCHRDGTPYDPRELPLTRSALDGETLQAVEMTIFWPDGETRPLLVNTAPIRAANGEIQGAVGVFQDITERVRAVEALRRERELLQTIYDTIPVMLSVYDPGLQQIVLSRHLERVTGWTDEDTARTHIMELAYPDPEYRQQIADYMRSLTPGFRDIDMATKAGGVAHTSWANVALPDGRQVGIGIDITERLQMEEALRESERRYRELVRHAPAGIYEVDFRTRRFVSVNDAMSEMTGYTREELLAMDPLALLDEQGRALFQDRIARWLSGEAPEPGVEYRATTKDGRTIDVVLNVTFTSDEQGRPLGAAVVAHDITRRKEEERRIARYNAVLRGINRILGEAIRSGTVEEVADACLDVALEVTGSELGFIGEMGPDGLLHSRAISDIAWSACAMGDQQGNRRLPPAFSLRGLYGRVLVNGLSLLTNDPLTHPDRIGVPAGHPPLTAFLGVPLQEDGGTVGMVAVANRPGGYSPEHQEDLEALAVAVQEALRRKRSEDTLRESEARYRTLFESIDEAFAIHEMLFDSDGRPVDFRWLHVNPAFERHTGLAGVEGRTAREVLPELEEHWFETYGRVVRTGEPARLESHTATLDRWYSVYAYRYGRPEDCRFAALFVDITERRRGEEALTRRLADLAALYDASQALLGDLIGEQILQRVCHVAVERFGLCMAWVGLLDGRQVAPSAVAGYDDGYTAGLRFDLDDASRAHLPVMQALRTGEPAVMEEAARNPAVEEHLRAAVRARDYRAIAAIPIVRGGQSVGVLAAYSAQADTFDPAQLQSLQALANLAALGLHNAALHRDLEHHADALEREVEERTSSLRESVALFRAIFDGAASGIGLLDEEGRLFAWNPPLAALLALPEERLERMPLRDVLTQEQDRLALANAWRALARAGDGTRRLEARYRRGDGRERWSNVLLSLVRDEVGTVRFGLAMMEDVTDARLAQQALLHAEKLAATGKLAASFAHEIRNPLQSVIGCLGLAREATEQGEDATRYFDVAHDELVRANSLVSRLRELNQKTAPEDRSPTDVRALLDKVLTLTGAQARERHVEVIVEPCEELPTPVLAADAMQQVFLNLTLNALEAMPRGGTLRIRAERSDGEVRVSFADTGPGVAPEHRERIFEGFFTTKGQGLGLGLFICQGIVQQHNGRIMLESEPGAGATFTVCLPL